MSEEKRWKVERSIEEREISPEEEAKTFADTMQVKSKTDRAEVVRMVKRYFSHVAKVHEEVASAVSLIDEIGQKLLAADCVEWYEAIGDVAGSGDVTASCYHEVRT